ncbi:Lrp/AsnC family transcriptional regulator [Pontibacillus salicampi]|uniref:Lrp/AsnC family transcriptional regulator n=1 Tax=Pontibacillus salicampi TaxID=1449801 RepID=A0ABV6LL31_9BACI
MIDDTDKKIIKVLSENGRISMKQLGEEVHLTGQAASTRVLKLEEAGIIEGYSVKVNEQRVGLPVHAFINIYTKSLQHQHYFQVLDIYKPYVRNNFKISGEGCYLLECRFPSNEELDSFLVDLSKQVSYKLSIVVSQTKS